MFPATVSILHDLGQIIERSDTFSAKVMLAIGLNVISSVFDDVGAMAVGTFDPF